MSTKQLITLSGAVTSVNAKKNGIKVVGSDDWLNVSQYHPVTPMPTPGELVEVQVEQTDRGAWINSLRILGGGPAGETSRPSTSRDVEIRRQVAAKVAGQLLAAAIQSHEDARIDHFDAVADRVLRWLERGSTATD
jgi:hypothetical protein